MSEWDSKTIQFNKHGKAITNTIVWAMHTTNSRTKVLIEIGLETQKVRNPSPREHSCCVFRILMYLKHVFSYENVFSQENTFNQRSSALSKNIFF